MFPEASVGARFESGSRRMPTPETAHRLTAGHIQDRHSRSPEGPARTGDPIGEIIARAMNGAAMASARPGEAGRSKTARSRTRSVSRKAAFAGAGRGLT